MIVLQTHALGKRFKRHWAVRDLTLSVERGDIYGFLGPNGAGKSTTIRMLLSLIRPSSGSIELFGKPLRSARREVLGKIGGLVEKADFYLYLSARRNLEIVNALRDGSKRNHIDEVLEIAGLRDRAGDKVKSFSHGMKQRLGIAQALLGFPEFIILDEPTSGLDPQGIKEVRDLVRRLSAERGITIFLSSHLLSEIEQTATSMAIINKGKAVVQGKVRDLLNSGENTVCVEATPVEAAIEAIRRMSFVTGCQRREQFLDVKMPANRCAELNAGLVHSGVAVHSLVPRRSLEEYFLSITEDSPQGTSQTTRSVAPDQ